MRVIPGSYLWHRMCFLLGQFIGLNPKGESRPMVKKQVLALAIPYLLGTCVGIGVGVVGTLVWGPDAHAASYQFNFNNVEQGANSTASPSLQVHGNEVKKSPGDSTMPAPQVSGDLAPKVEVTSSKSEAPIADLGAGTSTHRSFRLGFLASALNLGRADRATHTSWGGGLSASYLPLKGLGITGFGAVGEWNHYYAGLEAEVTPFRLSVFGLNDLVELGAVGGASIIGQGSQNDLVAHVGARIGLNLGDRVSVAATARTNLTNGSFQALMADAGLTVRF